MNKTDKSEGRSTHMSAIDWLEIQELVRGAETAIMSGTLNEWQHASTSTFHVLATALLDIQARLLAVEGPYPSSDKLILSTTDLEDGRDL